MSRPNLRKLLALGDLARTADRDAKLGVLRGGSSGCLTERGEVVGQCHRVHLLRSLGIEPPIDEQTRMMFDNGFANEDIALALLKRSWDGKILCEEEIPIAWETNNGTKVTGRPDIVLTTADETPVLGIELKQIVSIWTAYKVLCKDLPKIENVVQAAHYSLKLGVDFDLAYISRSHFHLPSVDEAPWFHSKLGGLDCIEMKDGTAFKILPFYKIFPLEWRDSTLYYESSKGWVKTPITKDGIEDYYNAVAGMQDHDDLGPIPSTLQSDGSRGKRQCNYCDLADICSQDDITLQEFIDQSRNLWEDYNE